jgi:hypothetical protein
VKCFVHPLQLQADLDLPRVFIHCTRYADKKPFTQFANRAKSQAGWELYDLDASHSPNVTAPAALAQLLVQILPR